MPRWASRFEWHVRNIESSRNATALTPGASGRKASLAEKSQIDAELSCLQLDASDFLQPGEPEQPNVAETEGPTETVDKSPLVHVDKSAVVTVEKRGAFEIPVPNIYKRVLAKKDSDASTPSKRLRRKTAVLENDVSSGLALVPAPSSPPNFPRFSKDTKQGMNLRRQNAFVEDANEELVGWTMQDATVKKVSKKRKRKRPNLLKKK
jgi:hypothetical protein